MNIVDATKLVQFSRSVVSNSVTPWTAARQASLSINNPELAQTHVHRVSNAIQSSILCCSLLLLPSIFPSIRVLSNESGGQSIGVSASTSVLSMNIQD